MSEPKLIISPNGTQEWWLNGKLHREDSPAIIYPDGTEEWRLNGKYHREDGPAFVDADGSKEWWLENKAYTFGDWCLLIDRTDEEKAILKLKYM